MADETKKETDAESAAAKALEVCGGDAQLMLALRNIAERKGDVGRVRFYDTAFYCLGPDGAEVADKFVKDAQAAAEGAAKPRQRGGRLDS